MIDVKVYSAPWCVWCNRTKAFLRENRIEFKDFNVEEDNNAMYEMMEKSGQSGIPVIDVNGEIIVGFDQERLSHLIGIPHRH